MESLKFVTSLLFTLITLTSYAQNSIGSKFIDPTGFYELKGKDRGNETYGYFGSVKVKLISKSKIAISFFICKGFKNYNSGSFYDTLTYKNNKAVYKAPEYDSTCHVAISFTSKGVNIDETAANYNNGCGFGNGVVAKAFFRRISKKIPSNKELLAD